MKKQLTTLNPKNTSSHSFRGNLERILISLAILKELPSAATTPVAKPNSATGKSPVKAEVENSHAIIAANQLAYSRLLSQKVGRLKDKANAHTISIQKL